MAHRSKRKFDSYQEGNPTSPAAMAQINIPRASVNTTNYYDDRYVAIVPTIELQRLYNNWRQLEEQELLAAHVEEQAQLAAAGSSHGGGQNPEFLRPPSLSATIMSRSPSSASTSNSVTGGMNDMGLSEDKPTKRKQGRQGPLDACGKAKAALVRKLNACPNCRLRKVKCHHHNFSLLEDAYQESKRGVPPIPRRPRYDNIESTRAQQQALLGVGVGPNLNLPTPYPSPSGGTSGQGDAHIDLDNMLRELHSTSSETTAPLYNFSRNDNNNRTDMPANAVDTSYSAYSSYLSPFSPLISPTTAGPAMGTGAAATDPSADRHVPIGRRINPVGTSSQGYYQADGGYSSDRHDEPEEWECRYGDDGTASSYSYPYSNLSGSNEAPPICKQRYLTRENLETHFQKDHLPYENGRIYPYCALHAQHYDYDLVNRCPYCLADGGAVSSTTALEGEWLYFPTTPTAAGTSNTSDPFQEQWLFGDIIQQPDRGDGQRRSGRVLSDGGGERLYGPLTRSGTVTQLDVSNGRMYGGGTTYRGAGYQAAPQEGRRRRGNSTFPGDGDYYSSPFPPVYHTLPFGPSSHEGGSNNDAHDRYGDTQVNLALSPPLPPSPFLMKSTMSFFALPSSKMLLSPLIFLPLSPMTGCGSPTTSTHEKSLCCPSTPVASDRCSSPKGIRAASAISSGRHGTDSTAKGRGRTRSLGPYYPYPREIIGSRESRALQRSTSGIRSSSSTSLLSSPQWPSHGACGGGGSDPDNSSSQTEAPNHLAPFTAFALLLLLLSLAVVIALTGSSSAAGDTAETPLLRFASCLSPGKTMSARLVEMSSIVCILLGLVGTWFVKSKLRRSRLAHSSAGSQESEPCRHLCETHQVLNLVSDIAMTRGDSSQSLHGHDLALATAATPAVESLAALHIVVEA